MSCREIIELLIDFVSDELPADLRDRIEQHLRACPPCVTYVETYRLTIKLTRQLPCQPMPPQLAQRLRCALAQAARGEAGGGSATV